MQSGVQRDLPPAPAQTQAFTQGRALVPTLLSVQYSGYIMPTLLVWQKNLCCMHGSCPVTRECQAAPCSIGKGRLNGILNLARAFKRMSTLFRTCLHYLLP